jgi:hypothetical protein
MAHFDKVKSPADKGGFGFIADGDDGLDGKKGKQRFHKWLAQRQFTHFRWTVGLEIPGTVKVERESVLKEG